MVPVTLGGRFSAGSLPPMPEMTLDRSLITHFAKREDPRCPLKRRHNLLDVIVRAIAATLCGADGWVQGRRLG